MAAAAAVARLPDVEEHQIAVEYPNDPNYVWHQRFLVHRLDDQRWIGFSADLESEVIDVSQARVLPLPRGGVVPARIRGQLYFVDGLTDAELDGARAECHALSNIIGAGGVGGPAAAAAQWRYGDTGYEKFGETIDVAILGDAARMVTRGASALVRVEEDGHTSWTFAERIGDANEQEWLSEKRSGPGRDPRVLPASRDSQGHRFRAARECFADMTFHDPKKPEVDWPFDGPSALKELLVACRAAGEELIGFHEYYLRSSGLPADHTVAAKHRDLLAVLHHLVVFDQFNLGKSGGGEKLARLILQIHQAVKRSPKNPDFRGTELMIMSSLDASGGVLTGAFAKHVAEEQKSAAFTMKQQRLYAEEEETRKKNKGDKDKGKGNQGKGDG